jgi:hypothetical protein
MTDKPIPARLVRELSARGHLTPGLPPADAQKVEWLAGFWREEWFIRLAMSRHSRRRRGLLAAKADLSKWERYVFQRYVNAALRRKTGEKTPRKLYMIEVAEEVKFNYGVPLPVVASRIPAIRKRAQTYLRSLAKAGGAETK